MITPDGITGPFISSPLKRQLEKCVVYLDDAHARGTHLKLPRGMRAAVTLSPKVTKDRLVQGKPILELQEMKRLRGIQAVCRYVT